MNTWEKYILKRTIINHIHEVIKLLNYEHWTGKHKGTSIHLFNKHKRTNSSILQEKLVVFNRQHEVQFTVKLNSQVFILKDIWYIFSPLK